MTDIEKYHVPDTRECLDYHHQKSNELLKELFYCNLCRANMLLYQKKNVPLKVNESAIYSQATY